MAEGESSKSQKCKLLLRILNIASALTLIGFGIAGLILMTVNNLTSGKFFLLFSPLFMALVGCLFLAAQFNFEFVLKHIVILKSYFGRGIFNLFMSSSVFYFFSCGSNNDIVGWIAAIVIFLQGLVFIGIHFCGGGNDQDKQKKGIRQELN